MKARMILGSILLCSSLGLLRAEGVIDSDICIYGGTSGGVVAAVAAARLGKNAVVISAGNHVGGMTASGLGVTDKGNTASVGGLAAEFYRRVGRAYASTNPVYWFEPHVAEQTFLQMLSEAGVRRFTNQQLASVTVSNRSISRIVTLDGTIYRAREFIDASYEGDLMAMSGVTYTWGREGTNVYNESLAGVHLNSLLYRCDPYVVPGNPASGLLPLIQPDAPGAPGQGDYRVQTYNFRLCLTQNATNKIPIMAPTNYTEATYELLHRYIVAYIATNGSIPLNRIIDVQTIIPNGKTDINAYADVSTDFIGYNYTYPTNTPEGRAGICRQHKDYLSGLLYYLGNSTNVPVNVRTNMLSWGYAMDEFQDNSGWPYGLYVREARRMIGDYVMLQQDAQGSRVAPDPVALASYTLDCHPAARLALNGVAVWEGSIGTAVPYPYPVSYRSIVPKAGECQNLFCTFALSASHVGFASVRMEPVFMMTSQSAATAACFAIDDNVAAQQVNYAKLAAQLLADGQVLKWNPGQSVSTNGILLTVTSASGITASAGWASGANAGGWPLPAGTYWHDGNAGKGTRFVRFNPTLPTNGYYDVYLWWVQDPNRASNTPVDIAGPTYTNTVGVNQQINGSAWIKVASSNYFESGTGANVTVRNDGTTGYVVANAARWMPLGSIASASSTALPGIGVIASDPVAGVFGTNSGRFTLVCLDGTNPAPLTLNYSIGGTALAGADYAPIPASILLAAGMVATNLFVTPLGNNLTRDQATVTLSISPSSSYMVGNFQTAAVTIQDRPIHKWLRDSFTPDELNNPALSGDAADPDQDGLPNLLEYALGLSPKVPDPFPFSTTLRGGFLQLSFPSAPAAIDAGVSVVGLDIATGATVQGIFFQQPMFVETSSNRMILIQSDRPVLTNSPLFFRLEAWRY